MPNIPYTIIIFPVEQVIELCYVFIYRILRSPGLSIIGLSMAVSTLILPLYMVAEKQQQAEREKQKLMKKDIDNIKAVFKGDKQFMMLSTLYRQNNYHPIYALRGSFNLLIQIPFFIAAWHFLTNLEILNGQKFKIFSDLGAPDGLLFGINLLPIMMTLINIASGFIYTKELEIKDKVQVYGIAAVFLVLLYNSPSALVIYWTCNNIYNLVKNVIVKTKNKKKIVYYMVLFLSYSLSLYLLFFHKGSISKRHIIAFILFIIPFIPLLYKFLSSKMSIFISLKKRLNENDINKVFFLSIIILFLLAGFTVPSTLIFSSVQEFSFIENHTTPFPFILNTAIQSFGLFILWPACLFLIFPKETKPAMALITLILAFIAIINSLLFPGEYGYISLLFIFDKNIDSNTNSYFFNILTLIIISIIVFILFSRFRKTLLLSLIISFSSLIVANTVISIHIYNKFKSLQIIMKGNIRAFDDPVYKFSKNGQNVLIIMLDRALSGFIPYIFEEKRELYNFFDGFTWYRNTISFNENTHFGSPGIFGGYEYANLRTDKTTELFDPFNKIKHNEALLLLPKIFSDNGFNVNITDPPLANYSWTPDLSIYDDYPQINAQNIIGKYNNVWFSNNTELITINVSDIIETYMIRFSLFRFLPLTLRNFFYDNGNWFKISSDEKNMYNEKKGYYVLSTLENYIALDVLPEVTEIRNNNNFLNIISNKLTHDILNGHSYFQAPDYKPQKNITDIGDGPFSNEEHYHANIAAYLLIGKWFQFLKENYVYDNTKIIIVSDHGTGLYSNYPGNIILPDGNCLEAYSSVLLVKDFNSYGFFSIDDTFMTNADVPLISLEGIVRNPVNPWTGNVLTSNKENGILINPWTRRPLINERGDIIVNYSMHVHTNIFDPSNWSLITN